MLRNMVCFLGNKLDFALGTVPIGSLGYVCERLRSMPITGIPLRAMEYTGQWFGHHWMEGVRNAQKAVRANQIARIFDLMETQKTRVTKDLLRSMLRSWGNEEDELDGLMAIANEKGLITS